MSYKFTRTNAESAAVILEKSKTGSIQTAIGGGEDIPLVIFIEKSGAGCVSVSCFKEYPGYPGIVYDIVSADKSKSISPEEMLKLRGLLADAGFFDRKVVKYQQIESFALCSLPDAIERAAAVICAQLNETETVLTRIVDAAVYDKSQPDTEQ